MTTEERDWEAVEAAIWPDGPASGRGSGVYAAHKARVQAEIARLRAAGKHEPGDPHQYRITCEVCGERGTIRLTVDPETALAPSEPG